MDAMGGRDINKELDDTTTSIQTKKKWKTARMVDKEDPRDREDSMEMVKRKS